MKTISVLTIVKNRRKALANLIEGLERNTVFPCELIIVHMDEPAYGMVAKGFNIREVTLTAQGLALAAARNFAVAHAQSEYLVFLDADCIPAPDLLERYREKIDRGQLLCGRTRYLSVEAMEAAHFWTSLEIISDPDPVRSAYDQYPYELFWSLNFACTKAVYDKIGCYDENYTGYGAEDTDFAFSAREAGVELLTLDAFAYHQYHPSYSPPLNHLEDIISNAMHFHQKWGHWPMAGWLSQFVEMKLIRWWDHEISLLRKPSSQEIAAALKTS